MVAEVVLHKPSNRNLGNFTLDDHCRGKEAKGSSSIVLVRTQKAYGILWIWVFIRPFMVVVRPLAHISTNFFYTFTVPKLIQWSW